MRGAAAGRQRQALRAGLGTLLAMLLTSALFAAPYISLQQDWGHTHPPGTPDHYHPLNAVLTVDALPLPPQPRVLPTVVPALLLFPKFTPEAGERTSRHARAPPASSSTFG